MKHLLNISLALMVLSFTACKKSAIEAPVPVVVVPKVKTFTIMDGGVVLNAATIEYDNLGRKSKHTFKDGSRFDFTYTGNIMLQEQFSPTSVSQSKYTYLLNAEGLAESFYNNATPTIIDYQTFNAGKKLLSVITKASGVVTYQNYHTYDNNGNNIKDSIIQSNGTSIRLYEYYADKISTITNSNFGTYYDGADSKNYQKKLTYTSPSNNITTYDYSLPELDAQGRVIKQSYTSGGKTMDYLYTYY